MPKTSDTSDSADASYTASFTHSSCPVSFLVCTMVA